MTPNDTPPSKHNGHEVLHHHRHHNHNTNRITRQKATQIDHSNFRSLSPASKFHVTRQRSSSLDTPPRDTDDFSESDRDAYHHRHHLQYYNDDEPCINVKFFL